MPVTPPPPRRKSCDACIKTKRRCDQQSPCARCTTKGIVCTYALVGPVTQNRAVKKVQQSDFTTNTDPNLLNLDLGQPETASFDFMLPDLREIVEMAHNHPVMQDWHPAPTYEAESYPERLKFLRNHMVSFSKTLLETGNLPFLNVALYEGAYPQAILDAFAACSTYHSRNENNTTLVFSTIGSLAQSIISREQGEMFSFKRKLSSLQALIVVQTIRIFDGNIRQRVIAEQENPILILWAKILYTAMQSYVSIDQSPWKDWLMLESTRRTVIAALMIRTSFSVEQSGECPLVDFIRMQPFTAVKGLWEAKSAYQWQKAQESVPLPWLQTVSMISIMDVYQSNAERPEIEAFVEIMLGAEIGPEAVSRWRDGACTLR